MRGVTSTAARNSLANAIVVWSPFAGSGRGTLAHAIAGHSTRRGLTAVAVSTAEPERLLSLAESQAQAADVVVVQMPSPGAFARPHEATLDPHDCLGRLAATLDAFAEHGAWLLGLTKPTPYSIETLLDVAGRMHGTGKHGGSGFVVVNPETTRPGESIDPLTKSLMRSVFGETRILGGLETSGRWRSRVDMVADVMSSLVSPQTEKPRRLA